MSKTNTSRAGLAIASVLLASSALVACSDVEDAINVLTVSDNLDSIQTAVFNTNCTSCHNADSGSNAPNLLPDAAFTSLVGQASSVNGIDLVVAGDAASSYLVQKLEGADGISGNQMPPNGALPDAAIQAIKDWINGGALDN